MSERDEFDAWFRKEQSKDYFWDYVSAFAAWQGARAPQGVPALTDEQVRALAVAASDFEARGFTNLPRVLRSILGAPQPSPEQKEPEHAHDWRFSLQDHMYKCDCGATRGDYPFGAASFKD